MENKKLRKEDSILRLLIIGAIAVNILVIVPIVKAGGFIYKEHKYNVLLAEDAEYGKQNDSVRITYGDYDAVIHEEEVHALYHYIYTAGCSMPDKNKPEGDIMTVDFGSGSVLKIQAVPLDWPERIRDVGVSVAYTGTGGFAFSYMTDKMDLENIIRITGLRSK